MTSASFSRASLELDWNSVGRNGDRNEALSSLSGICCHVPAGRHQTRSGTFKILNLVLVSESHFWKQHQHKSSCGASNEFLCNFQFLFFLLFLSYNLKLILFFGLFTSSSYCDPQLSPVNRCFRACVYVRVFESVCEFCTCDRLLPHIKYSASLCL